MSDEWVGEWVSEWVVEGVICCRTDSVDKELRSEGSREGVKECVSDAVKLWVKPVKQWVMECQCPTRLATVIFTIVFIVMFSISGFRLSGDISKIISKLQHLSSPLVYSVTKTECSYNAVLHENHKDIDFPILSNINITQYSSHYSVVMKHWLHEKDDFIAF